VGNESEWGSGKGSMYKFGTPYLFLQPLKLTTSNLIYNLGLGSTLPRNNFSMKIAGGWAGGTFKKLWDPPPIYFCNR